MDERATRKPLTYPPSPKGKTPRKDPAPAPLSETGPEKLLLFPEKLKHLMDAMKAAPFVEPSGGPYPVSVELSLTYRCNLACGFCSDQGVRKGRDLLSPRMLRGLFRDLAKGGTRGVTIEGGGEPTLSPHFPEAVGLAASEGLGLGLITNGLAPFPKGLDPGLYGRFQWIRVSLDASDEGGFLAIKGAKGFARTLDNIGLLAERAEGAVIGVGYVLTSQNSDPDKLFALCARLKAMGTVSYLSIRPVVDHPELEAAGSLDPEAGPLAALRQLSGDGFRVDLHALSDNAPAGNLSLPCVAHGLSAVIGAEGNVWLCGRLNADPSFSPMGNLASETFGDIWAGERRRSQAIDAADPAFCEKSCPRCRMTKYNRLLFQASRLKTPDFI
jgi:MoaA/NifB/PqqE/SkfB family radical SAM enzyme